MGLWTPKFTMGMKKKMFHHTKYNVSFKCVSLLNLFYISWDIDLIYPLYLIFTKFIFWPQRKVGLRPIMSNCFPRWNQYRNLLLNTTFRSHDLERFLWNNSKRINIVRAKGDIDFYRAFGKNVLMLIENIMISQHFPMIICP